MTYLSKLPQDIQELVVRLPFRVGLYISESDKTGGSESAEAERKALENIVTFYVEDTVKGEFAHEVMNETLRQKSKWTSWGCDLGLVDEECLKISQALVGVLDMKEIVAFKQNLIEIAFVVAQAYREFDQSASAGQKFQVYISLFLRRLRAVFTGESVSSNEELLNISPAERSAIKLLGDTMGILVKF